MHLAGITDGRRVLPLPPSILQCPYFSASKVSFYLKISKDEKNYLVTHLSQEWGMDLKLTHFQQQLHVPPGQGTAQGQSQPTALKVK